MYTKKWRSTAQEPNETRLNNMIDRCKNFQFSAATRRRSNQQNGVKNLEDSKEIATSFWLLIGNHIQKGNEKKNSNFSPASRERYTIAIGKLGNWIFAHIHNWNNVAKRTTFYRGEYTHKNTFPDFSIYFDLASSKRRTFFCFRSFERYLDGNGFVGVYKYWMCVFSMS